MCGATSYVLEGPGGCYSQSTEKAGAEPHEPAGQNLRTEKTRITVRLISYINSPDSILDKPHTHASLSMPIWL